MKSIKPFYEILTPIDGIEILKTIEKVGRTCYRSEDKITNDSASKFVNNIIKRGHEAMIEFFDITIKYTCDRGCCYSKDTKILTNNGFKFFYDLNEDDLIATKNDDDNLIYIKPINKISYKYNGKLLNFRSTQIDLNVTPNHNMWVFDYQKRCKKTKIWKFLRADELLNNRYMFDRGASVELPDESENIEINGVIINRGFWKQKYDSLKFKKINFFKFIGIWCTDGSISNNFGKSGKRIIITQNKEKNLKEIENCLNNLGLKWIRYKSDYRINCPQLWKFLYENFIINDDFKKTYYISIPELFKKSNYSKYLLEGIILGDGTPTTDSDGFQIYTASIKFAEDIIELCLRNNFCSNIRTQPIRNESHIINGNIIKSKVETYIVQIHHNLKHLWNKNEKNYEEIEYNDYVYCVELPEYHKLFVIRNGKTCWCGNSHELVRHRLANFAQESTRYVSYNKEKQGSQITVIDIEGVMRLKIGAETIHPITKESVVITEKIMLEWFDEWNIAMNQAEEHYMNMTNNCCPPELARSVLPNSTKTEINVKMNLRELRLFFKLRTSPAAHPQMRELTRPLLDELKTKLPIIFDDITY